jgi:predicted RNA-binding Zn-ribbon protein involved in translation (DUF1610 family)
LWDKLFNAGWRGWSFLKRNEDIMEPIPNLQCPKCGKMSVVFEVSSKTRNLMTGETYNCYGYYRCLACGHELGSGYRPCFE